MVLFEAVGQPNQLVSLPEGTKGEIKEVPVLGQVLMIWDDDEML